MTDGRPHPPMPGTSAAVRQFQTFFQVADGGDNGPAGFFHFHRFGAQLNP